MSASKSKINDSGRLTDSLYWDNSYAERDLTPLDVSGFRQLVSIQVLQLLEGLQLDRKRICEIGGGDAQMLTFLAKKHQSSSFAILDFSEKGCQLARERAIKEEVNLGICQADMFAPPPNQIGRYDIVLSQGVVEHFRDLPNVLSAKRELLMDGGKMFTSIPNFSSPIYAWLCKKWSRSVWEDHVPHTLEYFTRSHEKAKMRVVQKGYIGSIEFGMLSMTMVAHEKKSKWDRLLYLYLTRLCKLIHFIEHKGIKIPTSHLFSPFIYVIASKDE